MAVAGCFAILCPSDRLGSWVCVTRIDECCPSYPLRRRSMSRGSGGCYLFRIAQLAFVFGDVVMKIMVVQTATH